MTKRATKAQRLAALLALITERPSHGITDVLAQGLYRRKELGEFSLTTCKGDLEDLAYAEGNTVIGCSINGGKTKYYLDGHTPL